MASQGEQDLLPEQTEGFKVGEKKTLDEYNNMGKNRFFSTS
jgi:Rho GDP-dissociation inhibitor